MTPEETLNRLFAAQQPPARDWAFEAVVAERIARRRAWGAVGAMAPWAVSATAALWGLQPVAATLGQTLGQALAAPAATLALGGLTAMAALALVRRFSAG